MSQSRWVNPDALITLGQKGKYEYGNHPFGRRLLLVSRANL
jgi:hypothetical protein